MDEGALDKVSMQTMRPDIVSLEAGLAHIMSKLSAYTRSSYASQL